MSKLYAEFLRDLSAPKKPSSLYGEFLVEQQKPTSARDRLLANPNISDDEKARHLTIQRRALLSKVNADEEEETDRPLGFRESIAAGLPKTLGDAGHMAAGIVTAPVNSLRDAAFAPSIGERRPDPQLVSARFGNRPQKQTTNTYDAEYGAVSGEQRAAAVAQTLANIVVPGLGAIPGGALAMTAYGVEHARTPKELAAQTALGVGLGAGGKIVHGVGGAAGRAAARAIDTDPFFDGAIEKGARGAAAQMRAEGARTALPSSVMRLREQEAPGGALDAARTRLEKRRAAQEEEAIARGRNLNTTGDQAVPPRESRIDADGKVVPVLKLPQHGQAPKPAPEPLTPRVSVFEPQGEAATITKQVRQRAAPFRGFVEDGPAVRQPAPPENADWQAARELDVAAQRQMPGSGGVLDRTRTRPVDLAKAREFEPKSLVSLDRRTQRTELTPTEPQVGPATPLYDQFSREFDVSSFPEPVPRAPRAPVETPPAIETPAPVEMPRPVEAAPETTEPVEDLNAEEMAVVRAQAEVGGGLENSERRMKAGEEARVPFDNARKLEPLETAKVSVRTYGGHAIDPTATRFLTDGHLMVDGSVEPPSKTARTALDKLRTAGPRNKAQQEYAGVNVSTVEKAVWGTAFEEAVIPAEIVGVLDRPEIRASEAGRKLAYILGQDGKRLAVVDATKLALLRRVTEFDELRLPESGRRAVVALRAGKPVGILMPFHHGPALDLPTALAQRAAGYPKGGGATVYANPVGPALRLGGQAVLGAARWVAELPPSLKLRDAWNVVVDPASRSKEAGAMAGIIRTATGKMAGRYERAATALDQARSAFSKAPRHEQLDFMHRMELGQAQPTPALTHAAQTIRATLDTMRDEIRALGTGALDDFIVDYFPHIWKDPVLARDVFAQTFGKRPLEGSKAFLKERTIPTIADGIAKGLEPVTTNPVELTLLKLREMQRYHMAQTILREARADNLVEFVPTGSRARAAYTRLNDKIARVLGKGEYYAPEPVAKILNNYLSPGLRGNAIYDALRWSTNALNQVQLGLSAFHLGFTSLDAIVSRVALATEQAGHGRYVKALGTAASAPAAPLTNALFGRKIKAAYLRPGTKGAAFDELASWVERAGGRVKMDSFYQNSAPEHLLTNMRRLSEAYGARDLKGGAIAGAKAAGLTIPAALELAAKPLMEWIVPAQKLGVFGDLAREAMDHLHRTNPQATVAQENAVLAEVWNSVDNRMGQLVYDNLFWNKTFKDLSMASVRSVGWNVGTVRELGGGFGDIAREGTKALAGEDARLTHRAAYVIALPITVGMLGAVINYLATGQAPQDLKDYYFPRTGTMDADGNEDRVSLPSYMKDMVAYAGDPWQTVKHKMAPTLSVIGEMLNNEDFYGDMIHNPDDPFVQRRLADLQFLGDQAKPFSLTNAEETAKRGDTSALGRFGPSIGLTPAPRHIVRSAAQNQMAAYLAQRRTSGATPEDAEARMSRRDILSSLRGQGGDLNDEINTAVERGQLTPPQFAKLLKRAGTLPMQERFRRLTVKQALDVFGKADEREQGLFLSILQQKVANASRAGALPPP